MKPYIQNLLIVALFIIVLFLAFHCGTKPNPPSDVKTVYIKGKETIRVDTVKVKLSVNNPKPIVIRSVDTMYFHDTIWCDSIREYELKNDTVQINTSVQGRLLKQDVLYKMYNTDTKRVDTVFVTTNKPRNIIAPFVTINQERAAAGVMLSRGRNIYGLSYGTDQLINITYGWNLRK